MLDKFEDLVTEVDKVKLVENFKYAMSLLFVDRLEKNGEINSGEKLRIKDVMEDGDGNPRQDVTERMKHELRKIKIVDNREEVFSKGKEISTNYV